MVKIPIISQKAPQPIGPYVHAVLENYPYKMEVSGQSGRNPETGKLGWGIKTQTTQTLDNLENILSEVEWGLKDVIKVRIYLTNMKDYSIVNEVYKERFGDDIPARAVVGVNALPGNALIEIECTAGGDKVPEKYLITKSH